MSLRERKKQQTKQRIQDEAFRLVREGSFETTTIEAIAAAADVSPSTVYRYFGTKEGVLLWDELEPPSWEVLAEELERRPPLEALLATFEHVMQIGFHLPDAAMRERIRMLFELPELRSALRDSMAAYERQLASMIVEHSQEDWLEARVIAAVAIGTLGAALEDWVMGDAEHSFAASADAAVQALRRVLHQGA